MKDENENTKQIMQDESYRPMGTKYPEGFVI